MATTNPKPSKFDRKIAPQCALPVATCYKCLDAGFEKRMEGWEQRRLPGAEGTVWYCPKCVVKLHRVDEHRKQIVEWEARCFRRRYSR